MARRRENSKGKLYLIIFIIVFTLVIWLGTKDLENSPEDVVINITDQIKIKK